MIIISFSFSHDFFRVFSGLLNICISLLSGLRPVFPPLLRCVYSISLIHEQSCQEYENICLEKSVEDVEIETHRDRYDQRYDGFQKFPLPQIRQACFRRVAYTATRGLITISRIMIGATTGTGLAKCFYPVLQSVFMNARNTRSGTCS